MLDRLRCPVGVFAAGGALTILAAPSAAADPVHGIVAAQSGGSGVLLVVVIAALVVLAGGALLVSSSRRRHRDLKIARSNVLGYYNRLAHEINTLDPKDNATARQAVVDASERYTSAGATLAYSDTVWQYAQARRIALEGLYAAVTARKALGIDPGPPLPPVEEPLGDQLTASQEVTVRGQTYRGYPDYRPGARYYHRGGLGVPGGWYATPFWEGTQPPS